MPWLIFSIKWTNIFYFQKGIVLEILFNLKDDLTQPLVLPLHFVLRQILGFAEVAEVEAADFVAQVDYQ